MHWLRNGLAGGERSATAVSSHLQSESTSGAGFLDAVKKEIAFYKKLLFGDTTSIDFKQAYSQVAENDKRERLDAAEHDALVYRARVTPKHPPLRPRPWFPPESLENEKGLNEILGGAQSNTRVCGDLSASDVKCLKPLDWLNDEVVNAYAELITKTAQEVLGLKVHCWNTFFWTNLVNSDGEYCYAKVQRWTRRKKINIFDLDLMFIPLHVHHVHWSLGLIDFRSKLIFFFDSLGGQAPALYIECVRRYLQDEWLDKIASANIRGEAVSSVALKRAEDIEAANDATKQDSRMVDTIANSTESQLSTQSAVFDSQEFYYAGNNFALSVLSTAELDGVLPQPFSDVRSAPIPLQQNGSDCGVFTCLYMRELAFNRYPFHFGDDMTLIRLSILRDLINNQLELPN